MLNAIITQNRILNLMYDSLGEDIVNFLQNRDVNEVILNPDGKIWIVTQSKGTIDSGFTLEADDARQVILQAASLTELVCNDEVPILYTKLPDGSRFTGFLPSVVTAPSFNIRKHTHSSQHLEDYVKTGVMTQKQFDIIKAAIRQKRNIIVAGGMGSGKTTLLNAILSEVADTDDRVVMIEDTPELKCEAKNLLSLTTTDTVNQMDLSRAVLRTTPDRLVMGEIRGDEALALMDIWQVGHGGGCATVHSNSAHHTLKRLESLVSRVAKTKPQEAIGDAVGMIIYIKLQGTRRHIEEILAVNGWNYETERYELETLG